MPLVNSQSLTGSQEADMPEYRSTERVERDGVLIYPEGDLIPEDDVEELERQGLIPKKGKAPAADKSRKAAADK